MKMPLPEIRYVEPLKHTDDMQDIITAPPSWILRWGTTLFFLVLLLMIALSALIRYPDIVKASLKIDSPNSPKPIVAKVSGKLIKLLVRENDTVKIGQPLAYIESTASHDQVIAMITGLMDIRQQLEQNKSVEEKMFEHSDNSELGELQASYQSFFEEFLQYKSSIAGGFYIKKKNYLEKGLSDLVKQTTHLNAEKAIQQKDLILATDEYKMHQKLAVERVETNAELRQEESNYLAKTSLLLQTEASLVAASSNYSAKQKEILELDNQLIEEKYKFLQALNSLISQAKEWESKYILTASQTGKLIYVGIVQQGQVLSPGQEVFYIDPGSKKFFGDMAVLQDNLGKVTVGQEVLIKLRSYPFEEYGMIKGNIIYISDVPYRDSVFLSRVDINKQNASDMRRPIHLKQGMIADAEIVTQDATILQRFYRSLFKVINDK